MDFAITVADGARSAALNKALAAFNASAGVPLNAAQFVQKMIDGQLDSLVSSYLTTRLDKLAFLDRFTVEERVAIREAAKTNGVVQDYLELLNAASVVDLTSPRTTSGVAVLEAAGLIAAGRGAVILAL